MDAQHDCLTCDLFKPCPCRREEAGHCEHYDGRVLVASNLNCADWKAKEQAS